MAKNLDNFFNPKTIAVIGASDNPTKVGYALMKNLSGGAERKIYPVNLEHKEIPDGVELAVIAVRADLVPGILVQCGEKKILAAIVISAGFKEAGPAGAKLEEEIAKVAREQGIALLGPNCLGVIDSHADLNISFSAEKPLPGSIAFLSQSGALGTSLISLAAEHGVGLSKFISLGNEAVLNELDFLEYLANDDSTKAILIYLEKLSNGPEFMRLAAEITKTKPVVVLKAGRSRRGLRAVQSHTGSLAPGDSVFTAACRQSGVIVVESIREFFNLAKLFQLNIFKPLTQLVVVTNGGGPSAVATDLIDLSRALSLTELSSETQAALAKVLPPMAALGNPVDIIGDALSARYSDALKILAAEAGVDAIILLVTPQMMTEVEATAKLVVDYQKQKPIIPIFCGGQTMLPAREYLKKNGLSNFDFPIDAIEALDDLAPAAKEPAPPAPKTATSDNLKMLNFEALSKVLGDYQIDLSGVLVKTKDELTKAVDQLKADSLAMKIISPDIVHKTDAGAIKLNIQGLTEAERAWDEMLTKNPTARFEGMLVQPLVTGKEIIIGMKRDAIFGPTILFGLGGIFTEVLRDTSLRVAPIDLAEAKKMMAETKGYKVLAGLRGEAPVNIETLADLLVKISKLAVEHPEIKEIDFNPVIMTQNMAVVADARAMI